MTETLFQPHHHHHHHHHAYNNEAKMNDIFEQTVIVDKPLSIHFYDNLKEVTIDAEIVIGRKGVVEEIVPLEQWESVISETITEIPEEDWVIEPEEVVYTVVKWEGVEGGDKHVIENRQWKEVAHTPPIHTKHHVSPMVEYGNENQGSKFSFSNEEIHETHSHSQHNSHHNVESSKKAEVVFEKPQASARTETTWHSSNHHNTIATHQTSELPKTVETHQTSELPKTVETHQTSELPQKEFVNGYVKSIEESSHNHNTVATHHASELPKHEFVNGYVKSIEENNVTSGIGQKNEHSNGPRFYETEEYRTTWHKTHVNQPLRPSSFQGNQQQAPIPATRIPKASPTTYTKSSSPGSPTHTHGETKVTSSKITLKTNGNTVFSSGYSPQPSPPAASHHFVAAKPASHTTFMTTYTSNSSVSSPDQAKSPPRTPGASEKVTWRRTHGNQYVRESVPANSSK